MPPMVNFVIRRLAAMLLTLIVVTAILYAAAMISPPEERAMLYYPKNEGKNFREESRAILIERIIQRYGLRDPFPIQYVRWVGNLLRGDWGWSATSQEGVLETLVRLTPATGELTLYSVLIFIPLGIVSGAIAGWKKKRPQDVVFRSAAFIATSLPPFIFAIVLIGIFYVAVHWFPPERLGVTSMLYIESAQFKTYTGLLTIDGLLNGRADISLEAIRHLVLPVLTLSLYHWATLGRITRMAMAEEMSKDYITAARAHGITEWRTVWRHALRNTLVPALNSSALSAASLVTGVFVVEAIFNFQGVSTFIRDAMYNAYTDLPAALGFAVYSVLMVLVFMGILDVLQAIVDPRYRQGMEAA